MRTETQHIELDIAGKIPAPTPSTSVHRFAPADAASSIPGLLLLGGPR